MSLMMFCSGSGGKRPMILGGLVNSTVGVLGLFDVAQHMGLKKVTVKIWAKPWPLGVLVPGLMW